MGLFVELTVKTSNSQQFHDVNVKIGCWEYRLELHLLDTGASPLWCLPKTEGNELATARASYLVVDPNQAVWSPTPACVAFLGPPISVATASNKSAYNNNNNDDDDDRPQGNTYN
eukprot:542294-Amphidinium_carterae.1